MGVKTLYEYFYKLSYGAKGTVEHGKYVDNLDVADAQIEANKNRFVNCSDYDHPDDAITAIGASNKTLLVTEAETCDTNFTVPANVSVKFERGGKWTINTGITVTFNGQLDAMPFQIFEYVGTGVVRGLMVVDTLYPQWWGAIGDGTTDSTDAIQDCFDLAMDILGGEKARTVHFVPGTYRITDVITLNDVSGIVIEGEGRDYSTVIRVDDSVGEGTPLAQMFYFTGGINRLQIRDIIIHGNNRATKLLNTNDTDAENSGASYSLFENVGFLGIKENGYGLYGLGYVVFVNNCTFWGVGDNPADAGEWCGTGIQIKGRANKLSFTQNNFARLTDGIEMAGGAYSVTIRDNVFDNCKSTAVWFNNIGTHSFIFEGNYLEKVGGTTSKTISKYGGGDETISACLIFTQSTSAWNVTSDSVKVLNNFFVQCNPTNIIAINTANKVHISGNQVYDDADDTKTATTIAFVDSNPDTITDTGNGFLSAGFRIGMSITVSGSTSNNGTYTINTVTAGTITLIAGDALTAEGAGASVTITGSVPNSFIWLFGSGASYYQYFSDKNFTLKTENNQLAGFRATTRTPMVGRVLNWDSDIVEKDNLRNIIVRDSLMTSANLPSVRTNLIKTNPVDMGSLEWIITEDSELDGYKTYKFTGTAVASNWIPIVTASDIAKYQGRYVRLSFEENHDTAGYPVKVQLGDGVTTTEEYFANAESTWHKYNVLFFIDESATKFEIMFGGVTVDTKIAYIRKLQITEASNDMNVYKEIPVDYYKEGEWTMGVSFGGGTTGITYNASYTTGYYTKIGNIVTISGSLILTSKGTDTGAAIITGLPFTVVNSSSGVASVSLRLQNITFANQFQGFTIQNTTTIALEEITEAGVLTALTNADFADNSRIIVNCTYRCQ